MPPIPSSAFAQTLSSQAQALGFSQIGIAGVDLHQAEMGLLAWLKANFHGEMAYMAQHGTKRTRPAELVPGTLSVVSARMNYLPRTTSQNWQTAELAQLQDPYAAGISLYARGRDYHKVLRQRLRQLARWMEEALASTWPGVKTRVFTDSAPVMEVELATQAHLGWRGKHTLLLNRQAGSMFFLGEVYVTVDLRPLWGHPTTPEKASAQVTLSPALTQGHLPLPKAVTPPGHCGTCTACITACPTGAIVAPYRLDARRCISYLTIEHKGSIPVALRPLVGNRIYGCDDCQLVCPWNKFAQRSPLPDFDERHGLGSRQLVELFAWDEAAFAQYTQGSAIARIGHERWLRNVSVALGNALAQSQAPEERLRIENALRSRLHHPSALVREHVGFALGSADSP